MKTLLPVLIGAVIFAYLTEYTTEGVYGKDKQTPRNRLYFAILIIILALPIGLRRIYNDTGAYITGFNEAWSILDFLRSGNLSLVDNPAFRIYTSLVRTFTDNYSIYFMIAAVFVQWAFVRSIRLLSDRFTFSVGLYICLGTYVFSFAAMKQVFAMAFLMLAIPKLVDKKYVQYFILVLVAFLFHTYSLFFLILPFFAVKPWEWKTFALVAAFVIILRNFQPVLESFIDFAGENGKSIAEYEVFDNAQVNILRVLVYAVVPIMSLVLRGNLFTEEDDRKHNILLHMAIISFSVMMLGTVSGANTFARMAQYFEFGIICSLPWIIDKGFSFKFSKPVFLTASCCFLVYFIYANVFAIVFDDQYRAVTIINFIKSLVNK